MDLRAWIVLPSCLAQTWGETRPASHRQEEAWLAHSYLGLSPSAGIPPAHQAHPASSRAPSLQSTELPLGSFLLGPLYPPGPNPTVTIVVVLRGPSPCGVSSPPTELRTVSKTPHSAHSDVSPSPSMRILETPRDGSPPRERSKDLVGQEWGKEKPSSCSDKEWLGKDLPRCGQRRRAGPTAHWSPLCSQRTNYKVSVRLEVLLPLYRRES